MQRTSSPLYSLGMILSILLGHPWQSCTKGWLPSVQMLAKMLPPVQAPRLSATVGSMQRRCCSPTLLLPVLFLLSRKHLSLWEDWWWQYPWVPGSLWVSRWAWTSSLSCRIAPSPLSIRGTCNSQATDQRPGSQRKALMPRGRPREWPQMQEAQTFGGSALRTVAEHYHSWNATNEAKNCNLQRSHSDWLVMTWLYLHCSGNIKPSSNFQELEVNILCIFYIYEYEA